MSHVDEFRVKNFNCYLLSTETLITIVSAMAMLQCMVSSKSKYWYMYFGKTGMFGP